MFCLECVVLIWDLGVITQEIYESSQKFLWARSDCGGPGAPAFCSLSNSAKNALSTQFLKLLEVRTELEPNQIIRDLRYVQIEMGPDSALQMAWEILNKTYHTSQSPSQQLLKKLIQGPQIKSTDTSALVSFSTQCHAALSLHLSNHHAIPSLQEQGTLDGQG